MRMKSQTPEGHPTSRGRGNRPPTAHGTTTPKAFQTPSGQASRHARRAVGTPPAPIPTIRSAPDFHRCPALAPSASARGLRREAELPPSPPVGNWPPVGDLTLPRRSSYSVVAKRTSCCESLFMITAQNSPCQQIRKSPSTGERGALRHPRATRHGPSMRSRRGSIAAPPSGGG